MEVFINCKFARNTNLSYENNYLNTSKSSNMGTGYEKSPHFAGIEKIL